MTSSERSRVSDQRGDSSSLLGDSLEGVFSSGAAEFTYDSLVPLGTWGEIPYHVFRHMVQFYPMSLICGRNEVEYTLVHSLGAVCREWRVATLASIGVVVIDPLSGFFAQCYPRIVLEFAHSVYFVVQESLSCWSSGRSSSRFIKDDAEYLMKCLSSSTRLRKVDLHSHHPESQRVLERVLVPLQAIKVVECLKWNKTPRIVQMMRRCGFDTSESAQTRRRTIHRPVCVNPYELLLKYALVAKEKGISFGSVTSVFFPSYWPPDRCLLRVVSTPSCDAAVPNTTRNSILQTVFPNVTDTSIFGEPPYPWSKSLRRIRAGGCRSQFCLLDSLNRGSFPRLVALADFCIHFYSMPISGHQFVQAGFWGGIDGIPGVDSLRKLVNGLASRVECPMDCIDAAFSSPSPIPGLRTLAQGSLSNVRKLRCRIAGPRGRSSPFTEIPAFVCGPGIEDVDLKVKTGFANGVGILCELGRLLCDDEKRRRSSLNSFALYCGTWNDTFYPPEPAFQKLELLSAQLAQAMCVLSPLQCNFTCNARRGKSNESIVSLVLTNGGKTALLLMDLIDGYGVMHLPQCRELKIALGLEGTPTKEDAWLQDPWYSFGTLALQNLVAKSSAIKEVIVVCQAPANKTQLLSSFIFTRKSAELRAFVRTPAYEAMENWLLLQAGFACDSTRTWHEGTAMREVQRHMKCFTAEEFRTADRWSVIHFYTRELEVGRPVPVLPSLKAFCVEVMQKGKERSTKVLLSGDEPRANFEFSVLLGGFQFLKGVDAGDVDERDFRRRMAAVLLNLSLCELRLRHYKKCLPYCQELVSFGDVMTSAQSAKAVARSANCYFAMGDFAMTRTCAKHALRLDPSNRLARSMLSRLRRRLEQRKRGGDD